MELGHWKDGLLQGLFPGSNASGRHRRIFNRQNDDAFAGARGATV
jgi:hypothetical protein